MYSLFLNSHLSLSVLIYLLSIDTTIYAMLNLFYFVSQDLPVLRTMADVLTCVSLPVRTAEHALVPLTAASLSEQIIKRVSVSYCVLLFHFHSNHLIIDSSTLVCTATWEFIHVLFMSR